VECARAHRDYYPSRKAEYGPVLASLIETGRAATDQDYEGLEALRSRFRHEFDGLLESVDLMIAPCMPSLPPDLESMSQQVADEANRAEFITFTAPYDYSGHPTLTLPAGLSAERLPKSFQLIGRALGEPTLIRAGAAYERAVQFHDHPIP
jgi:amidase